MNMAIMNWGHQVHQWITLQRINVVTGNIKRRRYIYIILRPPTHPKQNAGFAIRSTYWFGNFEIVDLSIQNKYET
jgi:hypothetical protein